MIVLGSDRVLQRFAREESRGLVDDGLTLAFSRLSGGGSTVRCDVDIVETDQRRVRWQWLVVQDVQATQQPTGNGFGLQRMLIHQRGSRRVHHDGTITQEGKLWPADHSHRLVCYRCVQHHDVAPGQQLVQVSTHSPEGNCLGCGEVWVVHLHRLSAQSAQHGQERAAGTGGPDDADPLAGEFRTVLVGYRRPTGPALQGTVERVQLPQQDQAEGQRHLGHTVSHRTGGLHHVTAFRYTSIAEERPHRTPRVGEQPWRPVPGPFPYRGSCPSGDDDVQVDTGNLICEPVRLEVQVQVTKLAELAELLVREQQCEELRCGSEVDPSHLIPLIVTPRTK